MYNLVNDLRYRLKNNKSMKRCIGYGHLGDSNLHLNITSSKYDKELFNLLEPFIYEWTKLNNGSISAEHGIGTKKRDFIYYSKSFESIRIMKQIKSQMDPNLILNPYKVIPQF